MPTVNGVLETALYVSDVQRAEEFYQRVFGFQQIHQEDDRLHALAVPGGQVLLLFRRGGSVQPTDTPGGRIPQHDGHGTLHLAFGINRDAVDAWRKHLHDVGVAIESEVDCPGGGHSLYFRDPDGHLVEVITPGCWQTA